MLDTNIWLYISNNYIGEYKGKGHLALLNKIKSAKQSGLITIYINDIILEEWCRNQIVQTEYVQKLKNRLKTKSELVALENIIGTTDALNIVKQEFSQKVSHLIAENEAHVKNVEDFMLDCTLINIENEHKLKVIDLAIHNKAPFHNSKNNINDALILFSFDDFIKDVDITIFDDVYFVSHNTEEYVSPNTKVFHNDIKEKLQSHSKYGDYKYLWEILKLSKELQEELEEEIRFWDDSNDDLEYDPNYFECKYSDCFGCNDSIPYGSLKDTLTVKYLSEDAYKTQLNLFQEEEFIRKINPQTITSCGSCNDCGMLHFICPCCENLICNEDNVFECEECSTLFELKYIHNVQVLLVDDITIRDKTYN